MLRFLLPVGAEDVLGEGVDVLVSGEGGGEVELGEPLDAGGQEQDGPGVLREHVARRFRLAIRADARRCPSVSFTAVPQTAEHGHVLDLFGGKVGQCVVGLASIDGEVLGQLGDLGGDESST